MDYVQLLGSAAEQLEYERNVPNVYVPTELVQGFANDLFHPKAPEFLDAFTEDEVRDLCELYGLLCAASRELDSAIPPSVTDLLKLGAWRSVIQCAKDLSERLKRP
ncbi:MAG: hypothetical protein GY944_20815 [bacterium]|nr:hypothetical protein [bacterium]